MKKDYLGQPSQRMDARPGETERQYMQRVRPGIRRALAIDRANWEAFQKGLDAIFDEFFGKPKKAPLKRLKKAE